MFQESSGVLFATDALASRCAPATPEINKPIAPSMPHANRTSLGSRQASAIATQANDPRSNNAVTRCGLAVAGRSAIEITASTDATTLKHACRERAHPAHQRFACCQFIVMPMFLFPRPEEAIRVSTQRLSGRCLRERHKAGSVTSTKVTGHNQQQNHHHHNRYAQQHTGGDIGPKHRQQTHGDRTAWKLAASLLRPGDRTEHQSHNAER